MYRLLRVRNTATTLLHVRYNATQAQKANVGEMIRYLRGYVPDLLEKLPSDNKIDQDIVLRVSPRLHPNVPMLRGKMSYFTTFKATQFIITNFILNENVKFHILSIEVEDPGSKVAKYPSLYSDSFKIVMKWRTCDENCYDHLTSKSSIAKQGSHIFNKFDLKNLVNKNDDLNNLDKSWLVKYEDSFSRVISGIFIFELTKNCEKIRVHCIDNVEILDEKQKFKGDNIVPVA